MKYHIGEHILDTLARTLLHENSSKSIRPKTLTLLLFLAQRHGQIISKQTLLDSVWDDVQVDDGVIFQSVREIRQLFNDPQILLNHPRKGYEFTAELLPVTSPSPGTQDHVKPSELVTGKPTKNPLIAAFISVLAIILIATVWQPSQEGHIQTEQPAPEDKVAVKQRILVLPVQNHIPYGDHSWLYLGGMEQLISRLDGLPQSSLVFSGDYVLRLMAMAGVSKEYTAQDRAKLFRVSGASIIVETQARGNTADYKLIFRFHTRQTIRQGAVVADNLVDGFEQMAEKLAHFMEQPLAASHNQPQQEFNDALFAQAMLTYETDWQTSISFFESYLSLNPKSTIAAIYLSKLYLWQQQPGKAHITIQKAMSNRENTAPQKAEILLIHGRILARQQHWNLAEQYFQAAMQSTRPYKDWILKANIAEERGLAFIQQKQPAKAIDALLTALEYYHITQSPIGINTTSLHLAGAYFQQGELEKGRAAFEFAKNNIESQSIDFLDSMLAEYSERFVVMLNWENKEK